MSEVLKLTHVSIEVLRVAQTSGNKFIVSIDILGILGILGNLSKFGEFLAILLVTGGCR